MAGVEESDGAVEHVERKSRGVVRLFQVVVDSQLAGHESGDGRFADEVIPVDPGVDDQTKLRLVEAAVVEACRGGLSREGYRTWCAGLLGGGGADPQYRHPGRQNR